MTPLERLLDGLEVEVEPLELVDGRHACARDAGGVPAPTVHYTRSGSGTFELAGGATVHLSKHAVVVLPAQRRAWTASSLEMAPTVSSLGVAPIFDAGTRDPDVATACVRIRATYQRSVNLFDHLTEPLVETLVPDDPIRRSFEAFLEETSALRPGCRAMAEALLRQSLILLLRRCLEQGDCRLGWLTALEDSRLGRAIAAMHDRPEHAFSLPELADVAGMSRTVFAARFTDALAQPPIEFLKQLRLARAAHLLTRTDLPVKTVAAQVGYASRSSFTRAFIACHGAAPTAFRATVGELAPSRTDRVLKVVRAPRPHSDSAPHRPAA